MRKIYLIFLLILQGCMPPQTLKGYADNSIGTASYQSLRQLDSLHLSKCHEEWRKNYTKKRKYMLTNGNFVYVRHGKCGCIIHWEIDKNTKLVVGYKFEGDRCPK